MQLHLITEFAEDIDMTLNQEKYGFLYTERGEGKCLVTELWNVQWYPNRSTWFKRNIYFLGQDNNIGFKGELSKQWVTKEYSRKVKEIWNSELYSYNKILAHNKFATAILTPTFWYTRIGEAKKLDIKSRISYCVVFISIVI